MAQNIGLIRRVFRKPVRRRTVVRLSRLIPFFTHLGQPQCDDLSPAHRLEEHKGDVLANNGWESAESFFTREGSSKFRRRIGVRGKAPGQLFLVLGSLGYNDFLDVVAPVIGAVGIDVKVIRPKPDKFCIGKPECVRVPALIPRDSPPASGAVVLEAGG